ncbi:MAG TPA: LLM class flavin-dependent oxidoreductase [Actinoplanes sp.]
MVDVYTTCPSSHQWTPAEFRQRMTDVARWTEAAGCRGLLVYTDNTLVDPWAAAQYMIERTETLVPLVAVQPVYTHPFTVARMISTIGFVHGRMVDLNLVTGGFTEHLRALGCVLDHDERYDRLIEYGKVIRRLLTAAKPVTHLGDFYGLNGASVTPALPPELFPRIFVSGSSEACQDAQQALRATRLSYPRAIDEYRGDSRALDGTGIRLGIIARDTAAEAWAVAHRRFPSDEMGERLHDVAAGVVESQWHQKLSADAQTATPSDSIYWLYPFRTYKTFCPYLVGTYDEVADLLARYLDLGVATFILDVPTEEDDLHHATIALRRAHDLAAMIVEG